MNFLWHLFPNFHKQELYSSAHLKTASIIFPERINDNWLKEQWTEEEIIKCKRFELRNFLAQPSVDNHPDRKKIRAQEMSSELRVVDRFLSRNPEIKTVLSVGCGLAGNEFLLAKRHPNVFFKCIDISPSIEVLKFVANELDIENIEFERGDLRDNIQSKFDLVISMAVIYCLDDESIVSFVKLLKSARTDNGGVIITTSANIPFMLGISSTLSKLIDSLGGKKKADEERKSLKMTGWSRSISRNIEIISKIAKVKKYITTGHSRNRYPRIIQIFSRRVLPISNAGAVFFIE